LKSAAEFCIRGLSKHASDSELLKLRQSIEQEWGQVGTPLDEYPDRGLARRDLYPWNSYQSDRYAEKSVRHLNALMKNVAPKLEIRTTMLEDLTKSSRM
jgi:hypothetical protein